MTTEYKSHSCCFESDNPPCGMKGNHRCCICTAPVPTNSEWEKEFVELGAELEHARWAKWQNYLHSFLTWNDQIGAWVLPHEKKERWQSQVQTHYLMLSESEKESDRKEVRKYIPLIRSLLSHQREEMKEKMRGMKYHNRVSGEKAAFNDALSQVENLIDNTMI